MQPFQIHELLPSCPRGPPAHRRGKGVAVSLGTPADRHSQIRMPTCSGRGHYFRLLNSQVTQEQGVGPGLTFKTNSCHETGAKGRQQEALKELVLLGADSQQAAWAVPPLAGAPFPAARSGGPDKCWDVVSLASSQAHTEALLHPHGPWSWVVSSPYPLTSAW